eukprot:TRINITY_DN1798_c0_g1_i1.p1 TRINITY_DN1798_c0_g1~~TRINITY_DN1798_c0_g1_i1.p1  ORF type:complete len:1149 (+),score=180.12 TRINITY_DN1798_c0_g1_i1:251-3448(+)
MAIALVPGVSPIFPVTYILPLVFVLSVAALKDAVEDHRRYRADKRANGMQVRVVRDGKVMQIRSDGVEVGDFVYLHRNDEIPADLVVVATALSDGLCFVLTANLDGETNIKPRKAPRCTQDLTCTEVLNAASIKVECDSPHPCLVKWHGTIEYNGRREPLCLDNLLLRGCVVRNTPWVFGMVVYAGVDTKMFRNLRKKAPKFSGLDKKLNKLIMLLLCWQQFLILILTGFSIRFQKRVALESFYLEPFFPNAPKSGQFFLNYLTFFILLSFMMPISLFVSMELCKVFQAKFMELDVLMATDKKTMKAKTSNLNEELSQIRYIFTDKTGTLTENEMRFHRCSVRGFSHCEGEEPGGVRKYIESGGRYRDAVTDFMKCLALCHSVVISRQMCGDDGDSGCESGITDEVEDLGASQTPRPRNVYEGQSTDEVALVTAARANGFELRARNSSEMVLSVLGSEKRYELLATCEFTSDRKRMSVIVREPDGRIRLLMKGADNMVMPLLAAPDRDCPEETQHRRATISELNRFAKDGLRTLLFAHKILPEQAFQAWKVEFDKASLCTADRQSAVAAVAEQIEEDLQLLGCSGIEDRLQHKVPETISFFLEARIVIWMLTGDMRETAVNVAAAARLFDAEKDIVHHLEATNPEDVLEQLEATQLLILEERRRELRVMIVIDGATLDIVLSHYCDLFVVMGTSVSCAVCCRVTPLQKAKIVAMFQALGNTAMAVGDGANDVSMLQEAKVGVGIMGLEGSQAELASDYAIPKFHHLVRLVAVHGRFSQLRNSVLIQYSFYKNLVMGLTQVVFAFYSGCSGQTLFDSWILGLFNTIFTSLPPILAGVFEKDVHDALGELYPKLLIDVSQNSQNFNAASLCVWLGSAVLDSIVIYFVTSTSFVLDDISDHGQTSGLWTQGTLVMTMVVTVVLARSAATTRHWTVMQVLGLICSYGGYFLTIALYNCFPKFLHHANFHWVAFTIFTDVKFYLWIFLFLLGQIISCVSLLYLQRRLFPQYRDWVQSRHKDYRPGKTALDTFTCSGFRRESEAAMSRSMPMCHSSSSSSRVFARVSEVKL